MFNFHTIYYIIIFIFIISEVFILELYTTLTYYLQQQSMQQPDLESSLNWFHSIGDLIYLIWCNGCYMLLYKIVYSQIIVFFFFTKLLIFDKNIYEK